MCSVARNRTSWWIKLYGTEYNVSQNPHGNRYTRQSCDQHTRKVFRRGLKLAGQGLQILVAQVLPTACMTYYLRGPTFPYAW